MRLKKNINSFGQYLELIPEEAKPKLLELISVIKEIVPNATETISYRIPTFDYFGSLVAVGATKNHVAFYVKSNSVLSYLEKDLQGLDYSTGTIRFEFDAVLPKTLIEKIIKIRMEDNEYLEDQRKSKKK